MDAFNAPLQKVNAIFGRNDDADLGAIEDISLQPEKIKVLCAPDHSLDSLSVCEVLESSSAGLHHSFLEQMPGARFVLTPFIKDFGYVQDISGLGEDP